MLRDYARVPRPFKSIGRAIVRLLDRPLPAADPHEMRLADELRSAFTSLQAQDPAALPPSSAEWAENVHRLRELVLTQDPRAFLRWDVIRRTMFLTHAPYSWTEFRYLRSRDDWRLRWSPALREARIGHPTPLFFYPSTSGNLLHHAYHVARFEEATGCRAEQFRQIIEFGGGYGSMCRLFFNIGFKGTYLIFDLPAFSRLQEYYLSSLGIVVNRAASTAGSVTCTSDANEMMERLARVSADDSLFIATWSISETNLQERKVFEAAVPACAAFLIGFQDHFGEMDNRTYFNLITARHTGVSWSYSPIPHLPGNCYLFGSRRSGAMVR